MQTHGHLNFRKNGIAEVSYSELGRGRGRVLNAIGHPHWHPMLLLHLFRPYALTLDDGRKMKIEFQNLEGLVRVTSPKEV